MDERKVQLAGKALQRAVMRMQRTAPGLLQVYMGISGIPTDNPDVAVRVGVNGGSPVMEYNVDFVTALEPSLLGAIVYMECTRIGLHHCDRRKQEPLDMLKLASDVVVAEYARKVVDTSVGKNLEIVNRLFPSFWNYWPILQKHGFNPETDLTLEKLFNIFKEEYATMKPEEEDEEGKQEHERSGGKSKDEHETQSKGTSDDARQREGGKDGSENAETSGSPGDSDEQGERKDNGSSGEDGTDSGEEDSGENGDGGDGESGEGDSEAGQDSDKDSDNESSGKPGEDESDSQDGSQDGSQEGTPDERDDEPGTPGEGGGDGSSGDGADGGSEPGNNPGDGADGDGEGGDEGEGNSEDGSEGDSGSPSDNMDGGAGQGDSAKDDFDSMSRYFSLANAGNDLARWGQDDIARDSVTSTVNEALSKGMFDRIRGPLPVMLRNANRVKVDKEAMFRKFMTSLQDDERDETWSRRNRKFIRYGMVAPGYIYKETQRILFCVDVSGSMYKGNSIANCLTVMENVVNGLSIDLVYWDAVCSPVFNAPKSIRDMAIYGGGRTDPDCVLRKLGPERFKYDGLIFLTDCVFSWKRPPRHKQIMILRTHGDYEFPGWCVYKDDLEKFIGDRKALA